MAEGQAAETADLRRLRRKIDALDRRIVRLLNERAELAREVGVAKASARRRAVRDPEREREVLLRVSMANAGPMPQADLLAVYRRLFAVARTLERRDRLRAARRHITRTSDVNQLARRALLVREFALEIGVDDLREQPLRVLLEVGQPAVLALDQLNGLRWN